jgi:hypothetical protein
MLIIASTWLIFGIGAGLTEGGGIISRPKEHWFLLWIPLALIAALSINQRARRLLTLPSKKTVTAGLEQLSREARIIEEDGLGPKVLCLIDGSFLKLFRRRRWYTSGSFNPYSQRSPSTANNCARWGFRPPSIERLPSRRWQYRRALRTVCQGTPCVRSCKALPPRRCVRR